MTQPRRTLPPLSFFSALAVALLLHWALPVLRVFGAPYSWAGTLPVLGGAAMVFWGAWVFDRVGTTIKPFEESSALVTQGLYRYTRNPIYLGMVLVLLGVAVLLGSATAFLVVPVFAVLVQKRFIEAEEAALEQKFGGAYGDYRQRVRRWI